MCAPSQWETTLHYIAISHWLGAYAKWSQHYTPHQYGISGTIIPVQMTFIRDHSGYGSANERCRYNVTSSHIGRAHTQNDLCTLVNNAKNWEACTHTVSEHIIYQVPQTHFTKGSWVSNPNLAKIFIVMSCKYADHIRSLFCTCLQQHVLICDLIAWIVKTKLEQKSFYQFKIITIHNYHRVCSTEIERWRWYN